jgi:hypothetical protein
MSTLFRIIIGLLAVSFVTLCARAEIASPSASVGTFTTAKLLGCWRHDAAKQLGGPSAGYSELCFRPDGTAYFVAIAPGGGGDDLFKWRLIEHEQALIIDEQKCSIMPAQDEQLVLTQCLYLGLWRSLCTRMNAEGTACAVQN